METVKNYVTSDLFVGSAIVVVTGIYPNKFIVTDEKIGANPKVYMYWEEIGLEVKQKLDRRELTVCPIKLGNAFLRLKRQVLSAADQIKEQGETKNVTDKTKSN